MKKGIKPGSFIRIPAYPGGTKAMDAFISANLCYPEEAMKNKVDGSVYVKFDIDVFGVVHHAAVIQGIGHGCDEEALRLVGLLQFEKKKYRGLKVTFHSKLTIHFRLPTPPAPVTQEIKINYTYVEKKP